MTKRVNAVEKQQPNFVTTEIWKHLQVFGEIFVKTNHLRDLVIAEIVLTIHCDVIVPTFYVDTIYIHYIVPMLAISYSVIKLYNKVIFFVDRVKVTNFSRTMDLLNYIRKNGVSLLNLIIVL